MTALAEIINAVRDFLETGGDVLLAIGLVTFMMWTLILERYWYFRRTHPALVKSVQQQWDAREDQTSWYATQLRRLLISRVDVRLRASLPVINTLVALCPLLGLLGTVTGMIEVFDVMAIAGSGNARAMASGVSKATIPTMAGMVAALSGLYFATSLERFASAERERLADHLVHHERAEQGTRRRRAEEGGPRRERTNDESDTELNMTPMLDVVFIMLIFFIVTASFAKEAGIEVHRPEAVTAERKEQGNILVAITEGGQIWIDKHRVDPRAVRANIERLHAENPKAAVVVQADQNSKNRLLVDVMDSARLAGVSSVSVAATIKE